MRKKEKEMNKLITLEQAEKVINNLPEEFTSQDFLEKYRDLYEMEYLKGLMYYAIGKTEGVFRTYHSRVALFLSLNKRRLHIMEVEKIRSKNIKGNITKNQNWKKQH